MVNIRSPFLEDFWETFIKWTFIRLDKKPNILKIHYRKCKKCQFYEVKSLQNVNKKGDLMLATLILLLDFQAINYNLSEVSSVKTHWKVEHCSKKEKRKLVVLFTAINFFIFRCFLDFENWSFSWFLLFFLNSRECFLYSWKVLFHSISLNVEVEKCCDHIFPLRKWQFS